ncbi:hypothetical protein SERLADRAFT_409683 [Serpula lacrymans var. lacrymans S7.9]|uniref:Uncharacterized protein n=1 Tax=Serpula lacrymans var. lacrymans (strain S7.9) TaxID=578457 RepID=F8P2E5_SERL9|nr:uncharacterized protein SERLADRAFT_409683 [Serpula lacrymans var. lacrymans S7.9]EGO23323.1 hypothetical protein SERLADRAFT_409683 [Serpula lacrymans var. lacrymans S7.9]
MLVLWTKAKALTGVTRNPLKLYQRQLSIMPAADVSKTPDKSHQLLLQLPKTKMLALQPKHSSMKVAICASSIGAAMPQPILNAIDISEIAHYTEDFQIRIHHFVNFASDAVNIYSISKLPRHFTWGPERAIVGHILKVWFTYDNEPDRKATVGVVPLSSETADKVTTILFNLSAMDDLVDKGLKDIKAIKWQSRLVRGQNLPVRDLVLMEVNIVHYKIKTDERQKALNRWVVYWTHLEFMRLSLLYCSNTTQENAEEDESVIPEFVL